MNAGHTGRLIRWLPLVFVVVLFLPSLLQSGIIHPPLPRLSDASRLVLPWREFWRDEVLAGRLPLWNPFLFLGVPFLGGVQGAVFYPLNALFLVLPSDLAFKGHLLANLLLGGAFFYRLCRALGASREGAAVGTLAYSAGGQAVGFTFAGWLHALSVMCWAPAVLWALVETRRGDRRRRARFLAIGGVGLALQAFGGHPEWMYYTAIAAVVVTVGSGLVRRNESVWRGAWRAALPLAVMYGLGALLSGPQLLPALEAAAQSTRGQAALAGGAAPATGTLPAAFLPTLVVPRLYGPWDLDLSVDAWLLRWLGLHVSFVECVVYVGLVPLLLSLEGWRFRTRVLSARTWGALCVIGWLVALDALSLWSGASSLLPPMRLFRSPARFVFLVTLGLSVLSAFGATRLLEGPVRQRRSRGHRMVLALAALLGVAGLGSVLASRHGPDLAGFIPPGPLGPTIAARGLDPGDLARRGSRAMGWQLLLGGGLLALAAEAVHAAAGRRDRAWLLLAVTAFDLGVFAQPFVTSVAQPERLASEDLQRLRALPRDGRVHVLDERALGAGPNVFVRARLRSTGGYDTFHLRGYDDFLAAAVADPEAFRAAVGVRRQIGPAIPGGAAGPGSWHVTPVERSLPLFYWTDRAEAVPDAADALRRLPAVTGDPGFSVLVTSAQAPRAPAASGDAASEVTVLVDWPGRQTVALETPTAGWLVKNEMFYPGWRAEVNGSRLDVVRVNGIMQGIPLPAGAHRVSFVYAPRSLAYGLALFVVGLALSAALLAWSGTSGRDRRSV